MNEPTRNEILELARLLVADKTRLHDELVHLRETYGITVHEVAQRMGCPPEEVAEFEAYYGMDAVRYSFVERYALAIGARITTTVERHQ